MKIGELKKTLEHVRDDVEVVIEVKMPYATVGGTPYEPVKSVYTGFDRDNGRFFIKPEEKLSYPDEKFADTLKKLQDKVGWLEYEKMGLQSEVKRLKKKLNDDYSS